MKQLLILALALGCSASDESYFTTGDAGTDEATGVADLGVLEQAIYADDGYGNDNNSNACRLNPGWAGGRCVGTNSKSQSYAMRTAECTTSLDGINFQGCVASGIGAALSYLNSTVQHGWSVGTLGSCTGTAQQIQQCVNGKSFQVRCTGVDHGGLLGQTATNTTPPPAGQYNCQNATGGQFCRAATGSITFYPTDFHNLSGWSGLSATQKCQVVKNVAAHEIMHSVGLGHEGSAASLLMRADGPGGGGAAWTDGNLLPTALQKTALQHYNPGSGTNPL